MLRHLLAAAMVALLGLAPLASRAADTPTTAVEPGPAGGPGVHGLEEGVEAAEHGGGLPQLDVSTFPSQLFWLVVCFLALYWLLSRKALPRVSDILEARQQRIAADLDRAAALRSEAEEALHQYQMALAQAQARAAAQLKEAQDRLAAEASQRQAALDAELNAKLAEAERRIGAAKEAAMAEIRNVAADAARAAVQRLSGVECAQEEVESAVARVLAEAA